LTLQVTSSEDAGALASAIRNNRFALTHLTDTMGDITASYLTTGYMQIDGRLLDGDALGSAFRMIVKPDIKNKALTDGVLKQLPMTLRALASTKKDGWEAQAVAQAKAVFELNNR